MKKDIAVISKEDKSDDVTDVGEVVYIKKEKKRPQNAALRNAASDFFFLRLSSIIFSKLESIP